MTVKQVCFLIEISKAKTQKSIYSMLPSTIVLYQLLSIVNMVYANIYELKALSKLLLVVFSCFEEIAFSAFFLQHQFNG